MSDKNQHRPYVMTYERKGINSPTDLEPVETTTIGEMGVNSFKEGEILITDWNRVALIPATRNPQQKWFYKLISVEKYHGINA
jgi:hypothetical protein